MKQNPLKTLVEELYNFSQAQLGFRRPVKLFLKQDQENAENPLGKTANYDPENFSITIYMTNRHPKDILRSLAHELIHHVQNCEERLEATGDTSEGYAQRDPHLREMEREAFEKGNMLFRDWEDSKKSMATIVEARQLKLYQKLLK